jgi:intracellular sulfur oxidation DsrE/DsrF family protein
MMSKSTREVSVVFHLDEVEKTAMTLKNMTNLLADESILVVRLALVVNGGAISILIKDSDSEDAILRLIEQHAEIYACKNAMRSSGITTEDLIGGVASVPSGVGQLAILQSERCAYIRP